MFSLIKLLNFIEYFDFDFMVFAYLFQAYNKALIFKLFMSFSLVNIIIQIKNSNPDIFFTHRLKYLNVFIS
jgi:hypothetical protein